jgi:hypothetical protein
VDLSTVTLALSGKLDAGAIPLSDIIGVAASTDTIQLSRIAGVAASTDTIALNRVIGVAASTDTIALNRVTGVAASTDTVPMSRLVGALSSTTTVPVGLVDLSTVAALAGTNTFSSSQTITAGGGLSVTYGINADTITLTGGITASSGTLTATGANQYSIVTSSGISVAAGTVNVADTLLAAKAVVTNTTSSRFHIPALTTANLLTVAPADVGDLYYNTDLSAVCVSTGTATFSIVESSSPLTACQ